MTKAKIRPEWFTVREAAAYISITESAMRHWVRDRKIPSSKIRRQYFISRVTLEETMKKPEVGARSK